MSAFIGYVHFISPEDNGWQVRRGLGKERFVQKQRREGTCRMTEVERKEWQEPTSRARQLVIGGADSHGRA